MTDANHGAAPSPKAKRGRLLLQMLVGAVAGGGVTYGALMLTKDRLAILADPQRLVAMGVGLLFVLMGVSVALGIAWPRPGSVLLNVEDEAELRELTPDLRNSALMCGLIGAILLTLSVTATGDGPGLLSTTVGTIVLVIGLIVLTIASFAMRNMGDELDKALSIEASALAMYSSISLFGGWGILSYLGHAPWIGPLGLVAGMTAMYLVAIMWVAGKKGLLTR